MLATKLSRAQLELHAHRTWLRSFSFGKSTSIALNTVIQTRQASNAPKRSNNTRPSNLKRHNKRATSTPKPQNDTLAQYEKRPARDTQSLTEDEEALVQSQRLLREACMQEDFDTAIPCYRSIKEKKFIIEPVVTGLTASLLNWKRTQLAKPDERKRFMGDQLDEFTAELARDFRSGTLEPCLRGWMNLIKYFTVSHDWDGATSFWKWVEAQDDEHLHPNVYGVGIELLAAQDAPLEELEALYQKALDRFPLGFAAYHLSPGAVLPDRERKFHFVERRSFPDELLAGIMCGRFMRGDSRNAYLALDSALRMQPVGANRRLYTGVQRERPIVEAYTAFALACKAGRAPTSNTYRDLLASLRHNADAADAQRFVSTVRAMLSATYLYGGCGGRIPRNGLTEIIIVLNNLLTIRGIRAMPRQEQAQLVDAVDNLTRRTIAVAARFGVVPTIAAFNATINRLGSIGRTEEVATKAITEAQELGLVPTAVTWRSVLAAAGESGDQELVPKAWEWLVQARSAENAKTDITDAHLLVNACISSKCPEVARAIITEIPHLNQWQREKIFARLESDNYEATADQPANVTSLLAEFAKINADLDVLDERTRDGTGQDFSAYQPPMLLFSPPKDVRLPESEMRKLYDELTTDKSHAKLDTSNLPPPSVSSLTNVPFAELRYESWKLITYMMAEAERHDRDYITSVDLAIASGEKPPPRNYGELFLSRNRFTEVGLSEPSQEVVTEGEDVDVEKVRARIMELRKVDPPKSEAEETE